MGKKNLIYLSILASIIVIIGVFYLFSFYLSLKNKSASNKNLNEKITIIAGSQTLTIKPGGSKVLSKNLLIRFGRIGNGFSVPDIIFGDRYNLNDPQHINYLPLSNTIEVYDNGKVFSFRKQQCETKDVFTDVLEHHVADCKIKVNVNDSVKPKIFETSITKTIRGSDSRRPIYRPDSITRVQGKNISKNPLLYIGIPEFSLRDWRKYPAKTIVGGAPRVAGSKDYELGFTIITNFGIAEIVYMPRELFYEVTKNIQIGPAVISITPQKNVVQDMITNQDFSFQISMNFQEDVKNYPVNIIDFSY